MELGSGHPSPTLMGIWGFCRFGLSIKSWKLDLDSPTPTMMGLWDFSRFRLSIKSWKLDLKPPPPPWKWQFRLSRRSDPSETNLWPSAVNFLVFGCEKSSQSIVSKRSCPCRWSISCGSQKFWSDICTCTSHWQKLTSYRQHTKTDMIEAKIRHFKHCHNFLPKFDTS